MWREIQNAGHTPYFGIISLMLLGLSIQLLGNPISRRFWHYLIALVVSFTIGAASELMQIAGPRDADIWDLARDIAGAISFLGIYMILDGQMAAFRRKFGSKFKILILLGSIFLIVLTTVPVALLGGAYLHRNRAFPLICSFESIWEGWFIRLQDAELLRTPLPARWAEAGSDHVGRLTFLAAAYPGLAVQEPYPDWADYRFFKFSIFSELDKPVTLGLRIDDSYYNNSYEDRFNQSILAKPGITQIVIPIDEIRSGPAHRNLDMTRIAAILLFASSPERSFTIFIDNFQLE